MHEFSRSVDPPSAPTFPHTQRDREMAAVAYLVVANPSAKNNLGTLIRCAAAFAVEEVIVVGASKWSTHGAHGSNKVNAQGAELYLLKLPAVYGCLLFWVSLRTSQSVRGVECYGCQQVVRPSRQRSPHHLAGSSSRRCACCMFFGFKFEIATRPLPVVLSPTQTQSTGSRARSIATAVCIEFSSGSFRPGYTECAKLGYLLFCVRSDHVDHGK